MIAVVPMALAIIGLVWIATVQHRALRTIQQELRTQNARQIACESAVDETATKLWKLELRQDRLTNMVQERGWRDSLLLTKFDWRPPSDS